MCEIQLFDRFISPAASEAEWKSQPGFRHVAVQASQFRPPENSILHKRKLSQNTFENGLLLPPEIFF